ncbi:MAG: hypothetical protein ACLST7_11630 [Oscillospiraceae bacterium]
MATKGLGIWNPSYTRIVSQNLLFYYRTSVEIGQASSGKMQGSSIYFLYWRSSALASPGGSQGRSRASNAKMTAFPF